MTEVTLDSGKKAVIAKSGIILLSPSGNTLVAWDHLSQALEAIAHEWANGFNSKEKAEKNELYQEMRSIARSFIPSVERQHQ